MKSIAILWKKNRPNGHIELLAKRIPFSASKVGRLDLKLPDTVKRAIVCVRATTGPFSFFLSDVNAKTPIVIPGLGVAVTTGGDKRLYAQVASALSARGLQTDLQRIAGAPEATFEEAATHQRSLTCQTWLGVGRDFRIFAINFHSCRDHAEPQDSILPRFCGNTVKIPELDDTPLAYSFMLGRGVSGSHVVVRHLEDGALPILHATRKDDAVEYHAIMFVTLETKPLTKSGVRGTDYLVADAQHGAHMFTPEQQAEYDQRIKVELAQEETILCIQVKAVNTAAAPRYAFVMGPGAPQASIDAQGFSTFASGRVASFNRLNGAPLIQRETAILLQPGACAAFEFYVAHRPLPRARAPRLAGFNFAAKHAECRAHWLNKLGRAGRVRLPEQRIDEMLRAGLLHLDLITYGREPQGTLCPQIGVYTAIGSESSPIIQIYDSLGWHNEAERSLQFFLDKQHADGFMQNFGGYMLETGPVLWSMGEHWRYTRDKKWLKRIAPQLLKACDFMLRWRHRNKRVELRGHGYGLMEGKVADPEDHYRQFMLNGYAYLGLKRVAEMLQTLNPTESKRLMKEASEFRRDIRKALFTCLAESPVVPLGDGTWCPTSPPWAEDRGALMLCAKPGDVFSHGAFTTRDALIGPLYLVLAEALDAREMATDWLMNCHVEMMTSQNVAFSQPYYSRHDWAQLQRGEVKAFLQAYYHTVAGLADRETYTFWEHYYGVSPHKTHEEAWFLMQTRWMLWLEEGHTLRLLPGIPRAWLESGKRIVLDKVASYFGKFSLHVQSELDRGMITATIECGSPRPPAAVELRLPHPRGLKARQAQGGKYYGDRETVCCTKFKRRARVTLFF